MKKYQLQLTQLLNYTYNEQLTIIAKYNKYITY